MELGGLQRCTIGRYYLDKGLHAYWGDRWLHYNIMTSLVGVTLVGVVVSSLSSLHSRAGRVWACLTKPCS